MQSQIKIGRSASERDGVVGMPAQLARSLSLSVGLGQRRDSLAVPEEDTNSSAALRKLKQINDCKDTLRGRLSVLQIHEQKHQFKALSHQQKFAFLQRKHEQARQAREAKAQLAAVRQAEREAVQEKARKERLSRKKSLSNAREQLSKGHAEDYRQVKQRRVQIEQIIQATRQEEVEAKRVQQQQVREYERTQRTSVAKSRQGKVAQVREGEAQAAMGVSRTRLERTREVEQLAKLEMLMLHKQASSRVISEKSQLQLKQFLARGNSSTTKLPPISPQLSPLSPVKRSTSQRDLMVF